LKLGQFVLVSGETSSYYYDLKSIMFDGPILNMISELLLREVDRFDVKSVGGMGLGAGLLISAVVLKRNMKGLEYDQ
jgi:orotate phosphoribosyltransferase